LALEISLEDGECVLRLFLQLVGAWDAAENWGELEFKGIFAQSLAQCWLFCSYCELDQVLVERGNVEYHPMVDQSPLLRVLGVQLVVWSVFVANILHNGDAIQKIFLKIGITILDDDYYLFLCTSH